MIAKKSGVCGAMLRRRYGVTCTCNSIIYRPNQENSVRYPKMSVRPYNQISFNPSLTFLRDSVGRRTNFIETPEISGMRSVVHAVLFLTFFYLGFIRRWKRHSITTSDQDNEKIREVVTTLDARHGGGQLGNSFKSHSRRRGFPLAGSATDARTRSFCRCPAFGPWTSPHRRQARYSGDSCRWRLRLLLESAFSDGDSAAGRACPTARWSNIVSLPQRARRALDPLSRCEHAQNSMNAWLVRKG